MGVRKGFHDALVLEIIRRKSGDTMRSHVAYIRDDIFYLPVKFEYHRKVNVVGKAA